MTRDESLHAAIHEEVALHEYSALWPAAFRAERDRLLSLLPGRFIDLQHIGSTAVPGLAAKPIVDVLAGVESMAAARALAGPLLDSGYTTSAEFNATLTDRQWFMRHARGHRTHHLHVVVHGSPAWFQRLRFRDLLRADAALAQQYAEIKARLAVAHSRDREAYTEAKATFVLGVVGDA
ncbi:MAG: hypothetical protein AD742_10660 [Methylibium sp. NZG]|nr:MAG: hypothetical protein AD742_10660 [Methylibium sp. NZG]